MELPLEDNPLRDADLNNIEVIAAKKRSVTFRVKPGYGQNIRGKIDFYEKTGNIITLKGTLEKNTQRFTAIFDPNNGNKITIQ